MILTRRSLLIGGAAGLLTGCDRFTDSPVLASAEEAHRFLQRAIGRGSLATEFRPEQRSPIFRVNGTHHPNTPEYNIWAGTRFADWRLKVGGMVARPMQLTLDLLQHLPQRAQITRHDCVEGWSAIGKWQGPQLATILNAAGLSPQARYIVFHCADRYGDGGYYESIDLIDALHPQTILAWALNDRLLDVGHGAPLRLRVERQLGYKQAKYLVGIEAVASLAGIGKGKGGTWEDMSGYQWYAGI